MIVLDSSVLSWMMRPGFAGLPPEVLARSKVEPSRISAISLQELGVGFGREASWPAIKDRLLDYAPLPFGAAEAVLAADLQRDIQRPHAKSLLSVWHRDLAIVATVLTNEASLLVTGDQGMAVHARSFGIDVALVAAPERPASRSS